jgi:transcriptional regulator with XRE-family HTH domain
MSYPEGALCDLATKLEWPRTSAEGTMYWPTPRPVRTRGQGSGALNLDGAAQFPERTEADWVDLFDRAPHVMHAILGDIFREVRAEAENAAGKPRRGRRPRAIDGSLDELWKMITPTLPSVKPFGEAMRELIDASGLSLRAFAERAEVDHSTLVRMMSGRLKADPYRLEKLARAGHVAPGYFAEYRAMVLVQAVTALLRAKPRWGLQVYQQIRRARSGPRTAPDLTRRGVG